MLTSPTTTSAAAFTRRLLYLDATVEVARICEWMRTTVALTLKRKGVVLGLSGGIDSSVVAALAVKAFGPSRVFGIMMPEKDSSDDSAALAELLAESLGIETVLENITPMLDGAGCYRRRDEAIKSVIPEFTPEWKSKLVLPPLLAGARFNLSSVVVESPTGERTQARLTLAAYQTIVAATNFKQRCRKMMEYYHADRLKYAVGGTPNRLEYDQGFFVKQGDGAADIKPIAHLYKTQVYQLAEHLGVPQLICSRPPTTDTFSLPQSQEEFFYSVPYDKLDCCLFGLNNGYSTEEVAAEIGLTAEQVQFVYNDIVSKRRATDYLHRPPELIEEVLP
ncbi:MAG: NAD(+) synthase [Planctomycetia bacterium]|nr:NAD(+) synthase [Planctomycetia bacterium]